MVLGLAITNTIKSEVSPEFFDTMPLPLDATFPLLISIIKEPVQYIG